MISAIQSPPAPAKPTKVRYRVVALTIVLGMITYLDRVCISTLAPHIMEDLGLSKDQMSYVFAAFALSYAAFGIPAAAWADRVGTRRALTVIVSWWSTFTMLSAAAWNLGTMLLVRFLFGAGEAGAWPSVARTFSQWISYRERGLVQGIFFIGAHVAGGLTPLVVMQMVKYLDWRTIFVLFGLLGFVWAVVWQRWFRDNPSQHASVNAAELEWIVGRAAAEEATGSRGQETGDRKQGAGDSRACARAGILGPLAHGSQCAGAGADVSAQQFRLLFLHHVAAGISQGEAWAVRYVAGNFCRPAAGVERGGRSAWGRDD